MSRYVVELSQLAAVYEAAREAPGATELAPALRNLAGRSCNVVASGGAVAAARLAADLHTETLGGPATAVSPLMFVGSRRAALPTATLLLSARARHPDTNLACAVALEREQSVVLLTQRNRDELAGALASERVTVVTVPQPFGKDGFLATQSLMAMAVVIARLYLGDSNLPRLLPAFQTQAPEGEIRSRLLVLFGPDERPAADDLEARFAETGLAAVQVADYRSFAHGRHVGLDRHRDTTTIVALSSPSSVKLRDRTTRLLPEGPNLLRLHTPLSGAAGAIDLMVHCMWLPTLAQTSRTWSIERPRVPAYGRRLYHLNVGRTLETRFHGAVDRKLQAVALGERHSAGSWYEERLHEWCASIGEQRFDTLVVDYDGTIVETRDRFQLPVREVSDLLERLLAEGMALAFASGRGDSLHRDLRSWVPPQYWDQVFLGLHNAAWQLSLADSADEEPGAHGAGALAEVLTRLQPVMDAGLITVRSSQTQVSVLTGDASISIHSLTNLVQALVATFPRLDLTVASSGHSVDVFDSRGGKERLVSRYASSGGVLAVGDQGQVGGNDFALLAATPWSISVDRCSPDPSRCWNLARPGLSGPFALLQQLSWLKKSRTGHRLQIPRQALTTG